MKKTFRLLVWILVAFSPYFLASNYAHAQTCSGGGYDSAPDGAGSCDAAYIGRQCTFYGGVGNYYDCNYSSGSCAHLSYYAGMYNLCSNDSTTSCHNYIYNYYASGYTTYGCTVDYSDTAPQGGSGVPPSGGGGPAPTSTPTSTPTPTPTPRPDLAAANFKLVGSDGKDKVIDPLHWSLPHFYTGEDVCPYVTLKNISNTDSVSSTGNTWTAFYSNGSSSTAPAYNTASDVDVYLKNGQFTGKYSKTYNAAGTNSSYFTYKTGSNGGKKCWPAVAGRNYAWVYMNYDHKASDLGYGNNVAQSQYWVDNPPTYSISGKVILDKDGNGADGGATENVPGSITYTVTVKDGATTVGTPYTKAVNGSNSFSFNSLPGYPSKTYTVVISNVSSPYFATFPVDGSFSVTVGPDCAIVPAAVDGNCHSSGDITNLVFGINNTTGDLAYYGLSGKIWYDTNGDGVRQSAEPVMPSGTSATVSVKDTTGTSYPTSFFSNGNASLSNWDTNPDTLRGKTYSIAYTNPPAGYMFSIPNGGKYTLTVDGTVPVCTILPSSANKTCTPGTAGATKQINGLDFGLVPIPTPTTTLTPTPVIGSLTVSGSVYVDTNQNGTQDGGEVYNPPLSTLPSFTYTAVPDGSQPLATTANSSGAFTLNGLTDGQYTVKYTIPPGYSLTYPYSPNLTFTIVGGDCPSAEYAQLGSSVNCDSLTGSLSNLSIGITGQTRWLQSLGGDVRYDAGFSNPIPAVVDSSCAVDSGTGKGVSLAPGTSTNPGVLFSGTSTPDVGLGLVSTPNWQISGSSYGQVFAPTNASSLRTAYSYVLTSAKQQGQTITPLTSHASCTNLQNCTITNLASGVYKADGSVKLVGFSLSSGTSRSIVILINGFLQVNTPIDIPTGQSVVFIANNDIYIDPSVGVAPPPSTCNPSGGQLEGFFSSDKNIVIAGVNDCTRGADKLLNVEGGLVANATLSNPSNGIKVNRSICGYSNFPVVTIRERPDIILNIANILKAPTYLWREVAP